MVTKNSISIGIWGLGKMGKSALNYFRTHHYRINIMDQRTPTESELSYIKNENIRWFDETHEQENFFNFSDYIIPSPGINISQKRYATHKHKLLSELDFFYHHFHKPIIAITGSIGKTSVTHILSQIFKKLEIPVAVGGNIGTPTFDLIEQQSTVDYALLEVSSFQLMHCTTFSPTVAVWTNFYPNHLDYHASEDEYFAAKHSLLKYQKNNTVSFVPLTLREKVSIASQEHMRNYFTTIKPTQEECNTVHNNESIYYTQDNTVFRYYNGTHHPIAPLTKEILNLSFIENILLLIGICDSMKLSSHALQTISTTTELPAHRLEKIGSAYDVTFYNDSKGTTAVSTLAAVEKLKNHPLHLFLGGLSKGVDRSPLIAQLKNQVKHIYCFGKEADILYKMCISNKIPATYYTNLDCAIKHCMTQIQPGDCVLLSPAGSSYDLYENYEQRGKHFKKLITDYIQKA